MHDVRSSGRASARVGTRLVAAWEPLNIVGTVTLPACWALFEQGRITEDADRAAGDDGGHDVGECAWRW